MWHRPTVLHTSYSVWCDAELSRRIPRANSHTHKHKQAVADPVCRPANLYTKFKTTCIGHHPLVDDLGITSYIPSFCIELDNSVMGSMPKLDTKTQPVLTKTTTLTSVDVLARMGFIAATSYGLQHSLIPYKCLQPFWYFYRAYAHLS